MKRVDFPGGARFAFTILDDTDDTTLENGPPLYALLKDLGFRTTKTVWPLDTPEAAKGPYFAGETLQSPRYLSWVKDLAQDGFEIAFHNASMGSSRREQTIQGLDMMKEVFGTGRILHCNHGENRENLYWGRARYSIAPLAKLYALGMRDSPMMEGEVPGSGYFWGDVVSERVSYMRAFTYRRLDCSRIVPGRPYHDPRKAYVRRWFNTADAPDARAFTRVVTPAAVDRLAEGGGWSIVSTHLGKGFWRDGNIEREFERRMRYLASLPGWFVPATQLLDHLWNSLGAYSLTMQDRWRMEVGHALDRIGERANGVVRA